MKTETATKKDIPELLDFIYNAFRVENPEHPRFETLYPDLFVHTDEAAACHLLVRKDDKIVSCVGSYPMTLSIAGCRIPLAGIGQVSTALAMRGRGCMSLLLNDSIQKMEQDGVALSWLGGRHDRYSKFDWEIVGGGFTFFFGGNILRTMDANIFVSQSIGTSAEITDDMFKMREASSTVIESHDNFRTRLGRSEAEVWVAHRRCPGEIAAWAVLYPKSRKIADFCGSHDGILQILKSAAFKLGGINICASSSDKGLTEKLRMECTYMGFAAQTLLVVSLKKTIESYADYLVAQTPKDFGVTLRMKRPDGTVEDAEIGKGGKVIELDRKRMARLLFGPERAGEVPGVPPNIYELNTIFPLPFTLPELFHV